MKSKKKKITEIIHSFYDEEEIYFGYLPDVSGWENVRLILGGEDDCYTLRVIGEREETDMEFDKRIERSKRARASINKRRETARNKELQRLPKIIDRKEKELNKFKDRLLKLELEKESAK